MNGSIGGSRPLWMVLRGGRVLASLLVALASLRCEAAPSVLFPLSGGEAGAGSSQSVLYFPFFRDGDGDYEAALIYHTIDGTAVAGIDYLDGGIGTIAPGLYPYPTMPVYLLPDASIGPAETFQLQLDAAFGIGPLPSLGSPQSLPVTRIGGPAQYSAPQAIAAADLNGDGKPDLIVTNYDDSSVSVYPNTRPAGEATLSFGTQQAFDVGFQSYPEAVTSADINGDGRPDLIVAYYGAMAVLLNATPAGAAVPTFSAKQTFGVGLFDGVTVADINGDGKPDVIASDQYAYSVAVYLNTTAPGSSTATFASLQSFAVGVVPQEVISVDINGDGKPDLVTPSGGGSTISVLLNTTTAGSVVASFSSQTFDTAPGSGPTWWIAAADVNGDGTVDLVANTAAGSVAFINTTAPGASTASFATAPTSCSGFAAADLNGDGKPDLFGNSDSSTSNLGRMRACRNITAPGATTVAFSDPPPAPSTAALWSAIAVDLNGDGKPDLVGATYPLAILVSLNTTRAGPSIPDLGPPQSFPSSAKPVALAVADFNGDGVADIVTTSYLENTMSVLLGTTATGAATTSFAGQKSFTTVEPSANVTTGDINGDGKPDIVVTYEFSSPWVSVFMNTTPQASTVPTFAARQDFGIPSGPVALADLNGDGRPDLIVANCNGGSNSLVAVLLNTTPQNSAVASFDFGNEETYATDYCSEGISVADLNRDGLPDIATANTGKTASILLNQTPPLSAAPSFLPKQTFAVGASPFRISSADADGDGKLDLFVANSGDGTVSILVNNAVDGDVVANFLPQQKFPAGPAPTSLAVADMDGDGRPDVIVTNGVDADTVSILLNATAPGSSGSGIVSFFGPRSFSAGSALYAAAVADVNRDGKADIAVSDATGNAAIVLLNNTERTLNARLDFAYPQPFDAGMGAHDVKWADVNGDGRPDLVIANALDNKISVLVDTTTPGAATPAYAAQAIFDAGAEPEALTLADINGDGKPDVIAVSAGTNMVSVLLNTTPTGNATPTFAAYQSFGTGSQPNSVAAADVNHDGKADLIVANLGSDTISVLINTTPAGAMTATFAGQQTFGAGAAPYFVDVADLNGDGLPDIVVAAGTDQAISVLLSFTSPGGPPAFNPNKQFGVGGSPTAVRIADVNGDGKPDLIASNNADNSVSVLLNTMAPNAYPAAFAAQRTFPTGAAPRGITIADFDGDGMPDIATANVDDGSVSVLLNIALPGAALPSFAPQPPFTAGNGTWAIAAADANGDGQIDLAAVNSSDHQVGVLLNTRYRINASGTAPATILHEHVFLNGFE